MTEHAAVDTNPAPSPAWARGEASAMGQTTRWLASALLLGSLACGNVDVAGTLSAAPDAAVVSSDVDSGRAAVDSNSVDDASPTHDPNAVVDTSAAESIPNGSCDELPESLGYSHLTPLVTASLLALVEDSTLPQELLAQEHLFVDASCTYWVLQAGGIEVRTGVLDAAQAEQLWADLGAETRAGLAGEHGTATSAATRELWGPDDRVTCFGSCEQPEVDARVEQLFTLASEWTANLYDLGNPYDGGVAVSGVQLPIPELPVEAAQWPLSTPLADFFDNAGPVHVEGPEAELLRQMKEQADPTLGGVVLAEDGASLYALVIQEAFPASATDAASPP